MVQYPFKVKALDTRLITSKNIPLKHFVTFYYFDSSNLLYWTRLDYILVYILHLLDFLLYFISRICNLFVV